MLGGQFKGKEKRAQVFLQPGIFSIFFFYYKTDNYINKFKSPVTNIDGKEILSASSIYDNHKMTMQHNFNKERTKKAKRRRKKLN